MYATRVLADYVASLRADALSDAVRVAALRCVLDLLTAAAAGQRDPAVAGMRQVASALYGAGRAPVWFAGTTMNVAGAVLCNSTAASVLDLDDGNRAARGHPGAAVIPVALTLAPETGASAEQVLLAIVAGYEVGVRVATARNAANALSRQSGRWTGYAAVAAAARLRNTPLQQMAHAFAIAGVTAPNQEANGSSGYSRLTGNDVKEGIPWSTITGLTALHMAEAGLTGPADILDHPAHFSQSHLLQGLGAPPLILATYFKPYSCCRYNHCAIDAFCDLLKQHRLTAQDIAAVDVHIFGWALKLGNKIEPVNLVDVQYSIPYCIGIAALMGAQALLPVDEDVLHRPDVSEFASKVRLHLDTDLDVRFPAQTLARVVIHTRERQFASPVTEPRGEPANPLSWQDLREKFLVATRKTLLPHRQQTSLDAVDRFAQGDLAPLCAVLGGDSAGKT